MGERPSPDAPHPGKGRPPRAPSCRPHSAQSQLARARVVGLVTGPHARPPRTHSQWVVGPGRTPQRTRGQGWESARPRTPHTQARGAPPGNAHAATTACKSARCGVGDGSPRPHPPDPQPVGSGPRPVLERTRGRGWESTRPRMPHTQARGAPPLHPHAFPTAPKASSQERALWGWSRVPGPASAAPTASG